jgi:hypothetical protein
VNEYLLVAIDYMLVVAAMGWIAVLLHERASRRDR